MFMRLIVSQVKEEDTLHYKSLRQDPIYLLCYVTAKLLGVLFIKMPDFFLRLFPYSGSILSMIALYCFAHTLALLWGFLAVALAVASSIAIQSLDADASHACTNPQQVQTNSWYLWRLAQFLARAYQHYACLAVWWSLASSLFELGWEMYVPTAFHPPCPRTPHPPHACAPRLVASCGCILLVSLLARTHTLSRANSRALTELRCAP